MIFYDLSLQKWVRSAGLTVDPWEVLTIPIGASYILPVTFCNGEEIETPSYSAMTVVVKKAGEPESAALIEWDADYTDGNGSVVFEIDTSTILSQEDDLTPCFLQIAYTVDGVDYFTTLLETNLQNRYA